MEYRTVFDVTEAGFKSWHFSAFGLIFVVIGFVLPTLLKTSLLRAKSKAIERWFPPIFLGCAILWTLVSFIGTFGNYRRAVAAMRNHQALIVEGVVSQFHAMPFTGHAMESFVVNGAKFEYSDFVITAGFNNTASHGGPIADGLPVKIWHRNGEILRLDIGKEPDKLPQPTAASGRGSS